MTGALKSPKSLKDFFEYDFPETPYPTFIPLGFAKKIKEAGPESSLWKQFLPSELENSNDGLEDPIADEKYLVAGQLIHRYHNRALFLPTSKCPIVCRYCFRKNELYEQNRIFDVQFDKVLQYLHANEQINEIIFTGGDPLMLSDEKLKTYLDSFSNVASIKYIRIHTRFPVILPERIDEKFVELMSNYSQRFSQINVAIHVNHKDEITEEFKESVARLKSIPKLDMLSQSVLLKDINDCPNSLASLMTQLSELGIRPYYLHHPDSVKGATHFQLSLEEGSDIYLKLRRILPGWQLPHYVVEQAEGKGKIPATNFRA